MASYHLSVKSVRRSEGRSATAAIAYRAAERITCEREGRVHDYRAKEGVEASFIVAPEDAPGWAHDRQALWNAAEARETRVNSVTAREWELALPHELTAQGRRELAHAFARELVERYGVAADVAIHAPHREGDQRNWHAHVLTTTRSLTAEGLTEKTRALDAKQTGGAEVEWMRGRWAELQNRALERAHVAERVDHRTLAVQREEARSLGHQARADNLDRAPEVKLGPVVSAIERREERAAERDGRAYVPLTERGQQVHEARAARSLVQELARVRDLLRQQVLERAAQAREAYAQAREQGTDHVRAGLAALRAAAQRQGIGHEGRGPARSLGHGESWRQGREPVREERGHGQDARQEREASRAAIRERLGPLLAREGPQQERGLGTEAMREELERLRERARPGAERVAERTTEREAPGMGLPAQGEALGEERERTREVDRAQGHEAAREQLRGALDRATPVALEQEGRGQEQEREGLTHKERAHEAEREGVRERARGHSLGYGL